MMKTRTLLLQALFFALVVVSTIGLQIAYVGVSGYFNFGDFMIMCFAIITKQPSFLFAAGLGSMFADLMSPWFVYAPFTLVIKSVEYLIIVLAYQKIKHPIAKQTLPFIFGATWMAIGYALTEVILFDIATFFPALIMNGIQSFLCATLTILVYPFIQYIRKYAPGITK